MPYGHGSEAEIEQRQAARRTHGVRAFEARGENALEKAKRSRLAELYEIVQTRPGVLGLLQDRCVNSIMMCEIIESYIVERKRAGMNIESIPILNRLPAYQNSAQRCIRALLHEMPGDAAPVSAELTRIQEVIDAHDAK